MPFILIIYFPTSKLVCHPVTKSNAVIAGSVFLKHFSIKIHALKVFYTLKDVLTLSIFVV